MGVETLAHDRTTLGPEYGTLVPMRYMNADQHFKVVSVSALCMVHYLNDSARLGWAMRKAVEEHYDGTVAFLASGSLEPPLRAERPGAGVRVQDLEPLPRSAGPRGGADVASAASGRPSARCCPSTRPRATAKASCTTPRCCSARSAGRAYDGQAEVVTPYFGASGTGQINAVFPVTPQDGRAIPKAVASAAEGYTTVATRL